MWSKIVCGLAFVHRRFLVTYVWTVTCVPAYVCASVCFTSGGQGFHISRVRMSQGFTSQLSCTGFPVSHTTCPAIPSPSEITKRLICISCCCHCRVDRPGIWMLLCLPRGLGLYVAHPSQMCFSQIPPLSTIKPSPTMSIRIIWTCLAIRGMTTMK